MLQSIIHPLAEAKRPRKFPFQASHAPADDKRLFPLWIKDIKPEIFAGWRKEAKGNYRGSIEACSGSSIAPET